MRLLQQWTRQCVRPVALALMLAPAWGCAAQEQVGDPSQTSVENESPTDPGTPVPADPTQADAVEVDPAEAVPGEVTLGSPPTHDPLLTPQHPRPIDPDQAPARDQVQGILGVPASQVEIDPRVLGVLPGEDLPDLMREGAFIRNRTGRLLPADDRGYAVFILDPYQPTEGDDSPQPQPQPQSHQAQGPGHDQPLAMVVAPNQSLESMESLHDRMGDTLRFRLSGQVHTYRSVNYLLITSYQPWLDLPEEQSPEASGDSDSDSDSDAPQVTGPQAAESTATDDDPSDEPDAAEQPDSPEAALERLMQQHEGSRGGSFSEIPETEYAEQSPRPSAGTAEDLAVYGVAPAQANADLLDEGELLVRRAGRLVRSPDGAHVLFIFDADSAASPEPPMIVQACKLLEQMEKNVESMGDHTPFVITGQVQTYRGVNYLLPSIIRHEFDRQNLE